eukprot:351344-Chlamydomonas_euryale.AAC.3
MIRTRYVAAAADADLSHQQHSLLREGPSRIQRSWCSGGAQDLPRRINARERKAWRAIAASYSANWLFGHADDTTATCGGAEPPVACPLACPLACPSACPFARPLACPFAQAA